MGKLKDPKNARVKVQDRIFAAHLISGSSASAAARAAGLTNASAAATAYKMVNRPGVRMALAELGAQIPNEMIGHIAKGQLLQMIQDPKTNAREMVQLIRTGLEVGKVIGPASDIHVKHTHEFSAASMALLKQRLNERQENVIDMEPEPALTEG